MSRKLRIAMLGHKRVPSREGGVEIVVQELGTRMVEAGHAVCCYNRLGRSESGAAQDNLAQYQGMRIRRVFTIKKKGLAAVSASFFASIAAAFGRYDVVHIHAEGPAAFCWIPKLFGKRVIVTIHGLDHRREKWQRGFGAKFILLGEKSAVRFADEMIVLSRSMQEYFMNTYGRETVLIANGVNRPVKREAVQIRAQYGLDKDGYILFLGRLVPEKGLCRLIEAYKKVDTDKKLVIAGGSSDTDDFLSELWDLARGDDRIVFTGFVQGRLLEELYSNAYIYTLPSDLEGMPLSLMEAMSYGNCCLTSDIAECTEVVGDHGVAFIRGSVKDLQAKLQMLCDDGELVQKYRQGAADYVCSRYNWDDTVAQTLALYTRGGHENTAGK